jgi:hypothetical protein
VELVSVADLLTRAPEDTEPAIDGKWPARGWIQQAGGLREVELRAVLERTCVLASLEEQHVRWLVRCAEVFVDEGAIGWRPIRRLPGSWATAAASRGRAHGPGRRQRD